ncbi:MAG: ABC transporter permease [Bdellovibrionales bacterium]
MTRVLSLIVEIVSLPDFKSETWRTLRRQASLAMYHPVAEFLAMVVEPLLLLFALSWGLGYWLKEVDGQHYPHFVLPAVATLTCVFIPYWETAFGVFNRLRQNHGYWVAMQGPVTANDLANGELLWACLKGTIASSVVLLVGLMFGWVDSTLILLAPLILMPGALLSAAFGLWSAVRFESPHKLILIQGLVLGPLCMWSDTIFPFSQMSLMADWLVFFSPVGHLVHSLRMLTLAQINADFFLSLALLWAIACITANYAVLRFSRRLIPS